MRPAVPLKVLPGTGEVTPQVLMSTVAENYGICNENSTKLQALQHWVQQQALIK